LDKYESHASFTGGSSDYYDLPRKPDGSHCETVQDLIIAYKMDFTRGNIFKAVVRWEVKGLKYNVEKIRWFASDLLCRMRSPGEGGSVRSNLPTDESDVHGLSPDALNEFSEQMVGMLKVSREKTKETDE